MAARAAEFIPLGYPPMSSVVSRLVAVSTMVVALGVAAAPAFAQQNKKKEEPAAQTGPDLPDLVILKDQTELTFGACDQKGSLVTGVVAIRNNGKAGADRLVSEPLTAVLIPENLDMKDEDIVPNALKPKEILSTDVTVGRDRIKTGRDFNKKRTVLVLVDPYNKIQESNENNNTLRLDVTLKCK